MDRNEDNCADLEKDTQDLGAISVETKGGGGMRIEPLGFVNSLGISEE